MINNNDLQQIKNKGISLETIQAQKTNFINGFPNLEITQSASNDKGIKNISREQQAQYMAIWDQYLAGNHKVIKFVPASGAASRMFKDLYAFIDAEYNLPTNNFENKFFKEIHNFAFFNNLNKACLDNEKLDIDQLIKAGRHKDIARNLLDSKGLNYGKLPKGLLQFHGKTNNIRTAMEEHLAEGAMYAKSKNGNVNIHFTVSPEHTQLFQTLVNNVKHEYEEKFSVTYHITFSTQKQHTDTIAVNKDNTPFRNNDGTLLFRPAGHGALIENLNELDADIAFIKNIDNVVPDSYKASTVIYKKTIAGMLVDIQAKAFKYIDIINSGKYKHETIQEMIQFLQKELCIKYHEMKNLEDAELILYIKAKLNRPIRVCGMVKNVGEPGGGPFFTVNNDKTISLQILESSQIDMSNPTAKQLFDNGTHFNPVDLVCSLTNAEGTPFDLTKHVDHNTGFISEKSKDGKTLKALELPGLWNGAMSDWNTIFVEVPIETFNPVKTVNDLLRNEHQ